MVDHQRSRDTGGTPVTAADAAWITAILVLALALRLPNLNAGLWFDEVVTLTDHVRMPTLEMLQTYKSLNNHIFFTLQARLSTALFGEEPWALRLPAMLFGLASIWALWRLALEVTGPWQARLAALLMTVSYHHVWFSQNARGYTGLLFFALLATWLMVRMLQRSGWAGWFGYGACVVLAMYTHLSAIFFFLAQAAAYLGVFFWRVAFPSAKRLPAIAMPVAAGGAAALVTLALYAPIIGQMVTAFTEVRTGPDSVVKVESVAEWQSPLWMIEEVISGFGAFGPLAAVAVPVVLVVVVIGLAGQFRRAPVVPLTLLIHLPLTVAILLALSFRVWPRYFLIDIGLVCLLLTHGAFLIGAWLAPRLGIAPLAKGERLGILLAAAGVAASLVLLSANYLHPKQDYAGARDYVEANRAPDAVVIALGVGAMAFERLYAPHWHSVETLEAFQALRVPGKETWLVYTFPDVMKRRHADILDAASDFEKVAYLHGTLSDGGLVILRARAD